MSEIAVRVSGLTYAYPDGPTALDGVSLELASGESVGLVGPNGAGKTTLFLCLSGVLPAPRGRIALLGLDPADPAQRRRLPEHVGIVFQNSDDQLFNTTVLDDVAFGPLNLGLPPDEVRRRVAEALARVGLSGFEGRGAVPPLRRREAARRPGRRAGDAAGGAAAGRAVDVPRPARPARADRAGQRAWPGRS